MKFINNSILSKHYADYLQALDLNEDIISQTLSDLDLLNLNDPKYKLTEFDIYKYITATEYITESLGCDKYKLKEGITKDTYKYNNVLIDLIFRNIPRQIINNYPISVVFGIKQEVQVILDLTKTDMYNIRNSFDFEELIISTKRFNYIDKNILNTLVILIPITSLSN